MWFDQIRRGNARDYERFASGIVSADDCVLTFNYDVSLEPHLMHQGKWSLGDGYGFEIDGFDKPSQVKLLKLHGSVNWRFPPFWNGRPLIDTSELAFLGYRGHSDPLYSGPIAETFGTMILPARCKQFFVETSLGRLHEEFWDDLWIQAVDSLKRSEEIVICGYSIPELDERACDLLLRKNYSASVEVCCGRDSQRIVAQLLSAGRNAHAARETHFDGWLDARLSSE
jgi:hypothetical protein